MRRGLARAGRTQRWPAAADAAQLDRCCRAQATELGADADALASLPRAAALRWPSLKKDLASRAEAAKATFARRSAVVAAREEARREQALRGRRRKNKAKPAAKDLSQKEGYLSKKAEKSKKGEKKKGEKAKGEEKKADDEVNFDDLGGLVEESVDVLLRELCEAAGRETCPSSDVLSRLCLYERIDDEGVARKMWALSGGDPERLRSCASKALKEGLVKGSEGMIEDPLAIEGAGLGYVRVAGRLNFEAGAPREPEEPPKMFKLDDAAIEKWIRGQKISTDRIPAAAAARRAWLLRKAGGAANAALQARRMFAKARAATPDVNLGSAAERQCRRLERRLVRKERKERIKRARAALALDGGLDADEADVEVVNALAGYGAGGLQRPLKEKDIIRIKSWGHGLLKILEREADSDDDDGGVEGRMPSSRRSATSKRRSSLRSSSSSSTVPTASRAPSPPTWSRRSRSSGSKSDRPTPTRSRARETPGRSGRNEMIENGRTRRKRRTSARRPSVRRARRFGQSTPSARESSSTPKSSSGTAAATR